MAEFLIKAVDANHSDPHKDRCGCYKRGDIVEVRPDGATYGKEECLPKFLIIKIPGSLKSMGGYMKPDETGPSGNRKVRTRRKYKFDIQKWLSATQLEEVRRSNWQINSFPKTTIENKNGN